MQCLTVIASQGVMLMKAAVYRKYGGPEVLQLTELDKPVPGENEILVRVHASTVCVGDIKVRSFKDIPPLFWLPYISNDSSVSNNHFV